MTRSITSLLERHFTRTPRGGTVGREVRGAAVHRAMYLAAAAFAAYFAWEKPA